MSHNCRKIVLECFVNLAPLLCVKMYLSMNVELLLIQLQCGLLVCTCIWCLCIGDKELEEFLKEEIQMEKQQKKSSAGTLPKIKGFEITKTEGPNVILSKKFDSEMWVCASFFYCALLNVCFLTYIWLFMGNHWSSSFQISKFAKKVSVTLLSSYSV